MPNPYTTQEILQKYKKYIGKRKPGLKRFYDPDGPDQRLGDCATRGSAMATRLMARGCPWEAAAEFTLLALWDLVVLIGMDCLHMFFLCCVPVVIFTLSLTPAVVLLVVSTDGRDIDNSISMGIGEGGARVETLNETLRATSAVYSLARTEGIKAIRLLNNSAIYSNVTPNRIASLMENIVFEGLTSIGTKLRDKVLVNYVTPNMEKPLLVIVLTDAEVRHLRK